MMKASITARKNYKKRKLGHKASNVGASFAAVAVVCAAFNPTVAECVAIAGVFADFGTRMVLRFM